MMMSRLFRSVILKLDSALLPVCAPRLASHDLSSWSQNHTFNTRHTQDQNANYEEDLSPDDVEAQIEAVIREEKRKQKTVKFHKIKRQLRPKGAPERKLTWDAIEQIRFLKQESPEEWTVGRLAEGFSVTPSEIARILQSKFIPAPQRKLKQDQTVLAKQQQLTLADGTDVQRPKSLPTTPSTHLALAKGQEHLSLEDGSGVQPKKRLPTSSTHITLPDRLTGALVASRQNQDVVTATAKGKTAHTLKGSSAVSLRPTPQSTALKTNSVVSTVASRRQDETVKTGEKMAEVWDGVILTESELQELSQTLTDKPPSVVKSGREYFDTEGNFLYRV